MHRDGVFPTVGGRIVALASAHHDESEFLVEFNRSEVAGSNFQEPMLDIAFAAEFAQLIHEHRGITFTARQRIDGDAKQFAFVKNTAENRIALKLTVSSENQTGVFLQRTGE